MDKSVFLRAAENFVGYTATVSSIVSLTPALDTSIYANNDVLFAPTELPASTRKGNGRAVLENILVLDEDAQGQAIDFYFFDSNPTSFGAANAVVGITDADARKLVGIASVVAGDYKDLVGSKVAHVKSILAYMQSLGGTSFWVAGVVRSGTPTYTAAGLKLKFAFRQA